MNKIQINKIFNEYKEYMEIQFNMPRKLMNNKTLSIEQDKLIDIENDYIYYISIHPQIDFKYTILLYFYNEFIQLTVYRVDKQILDKINDKFILRKRYNSHYHTYDIESIEFSYTQNKKIKDLLLNFI